mgnify:CR=1 FL=1
MESLYNKAYRWRHHRTTVSRPEDLVDHRAWYEYTWHDTTTRDPSGSQPFLAVRVSADTTPGATGPTPTLGRSPVGTFP